VFLVHAVPQNTRVAFVKALDLGADMIEFDVQLTRDDVAIVFHDETLERTTNGSGRVGETDFSTISRLDAGSWFDPKFTGARIPTFQEAIDLVRGKAGLYPELKDPEFYRLRGVSPEALFAGMLRKNAIVDDPKTPVILQSFDEATLRSAGKVVPVVPRVFLVGTQDAARLDAPEKVREIATWATGLGPDKAIVEQRPSLVAWAHAAGLTVTPWTFRSSGTGRFASVRDEMAYFLFELGVDALFTDNPDLFPRPR